MAASGLSLCAAELRRGDRDRFLTALFAPADRREALFALYAFNLELARIRESVSQPMLGLIRLQWWRDGLDAIFRPRSIAVIGASRDRTSIGREILHNLIEYEFAGPIFPVNPKSSSVHSLKCYPDVEAIHAAVRCGLLDESEVTWVGGREFTRGLDRLRVLAAGKGGTG